MFSFSPERKEKKLEEEAICSLDTMEDGRGVEVQTEEKRGGEIRRA